MQAPRLNPKLWLGLASRALGRADHWLDDPSVEFWVCVVLMLLTPLMRLGFAQIVAWLTGRPAIP